jgi:hypothetical protein
LPSIFTLPGKGHNFLLESDLNKTHYWVTFLVDRASVVLKLGGCGYGGDLEPSATAELAYHLFVPEHQSSLLCYKKTKADNVILFLLNKDKRPH